MADDIQGGDFDDGFEEGGGRHRRYDSTDDLMLRHVPGQAGRSSAKLRELLTGTILLHIINRGKRYRLDWTKEKLTVDAVTESLPSDCEIQTTEENLLRVANGELNPQIAMLSDKIKVKGRQSLAMYLFNLIAPRTL